MSAPANRPNAGLRGERESLLNTPALLIMSAVVVIALYVLFPRQPAFRDPQNLRASDALSIAYLRVLVRSDPDNIPLRLSFVQLLTEAGANDEATEALAPLLVKAPPEHAFEIGLAKTRLQLQLLFLAPAAESAQALRTDIGRGFDQLLPLAQKVSEQDLLLVEARKFGDPRVLAALYESLLARVDSSGPRRGRLLSETAALHLAANQPGEAARRWQQAFALLVDADEQRNVALSSLRAFLAAGEPAQALTAAKRFLHKRTADAELLALAADIAQQNGDDGQALSWLYALRPLQPEDPQLTERLLALELALGDLPAALPLARELTTDVIAGSPRQWLLARAFDWNGLQAESLPHWFALAMTAPDEESETRAFELAVALNDDDKVVQLVEAAALRRPLRGNEAAAYVSSGLRTQEPTRLVATLQNYLQQIDAGSTANGGAKPAPDRAAWVALARVQQARGEPLAALQAWQRAEQLAPLKPTERLAIAQAYWRSGQAEPALNSLLPLSSAPPAGQEARYWRLLAEIAWSLERSNVTRTAYQQLLARFAADDKQAIDRLLQLAEQSGDVAATERQALYGWSRLRSREYFVELLELAHQAGDNARLDQLLADAEQQQSRFAKEPRYWQYRAERAMSRGDIVLGKSSLEKLAALRANDPEVIEAQLWALLAESPASNPAIYLLIERYAGLAAGDPVLAEAMAAAEQTLGRPAEAAVWYLQTLPARKRDLPWLLTVADNLEWLGCTVTANQFRLRSLQQLQVQPVPFPAVAHPARLADYFYGRKFFARDLEEVLPEAEDFRDLIEQWQLQTGLDNARQFALHWQQKRLTLSAWEDLADEWQEQNGQEMAKMIQALSAELQLAPEGPLSSNVLPLSLNDVAARARRFGAGRSGSLPAPDPTRELPICRQTLEQFSALALPLPVLAVPRPAVAATTNASTNETFNATSTATTITATTAARSAATTISVATTTPTATQTTAQTTTQTTTPTTVKP
ncbi:tetratricopeptide repeat protein [Permianibacter sp. IMCC34836]|uniref:tetratricopeptide repeat protein n=1 Tax=Permianibacter fluminis TaxID=2738515 RepID=UPI0015574C09|nr:tetratricopeptide repeat protein [Permianibacter fluminis]NQD37309.1 tetratricopeptide repeat protein [Permianibacter fluminis]